MQVTLAFVMMSVIVMSVGVSSLPMEERLAQPHGIQAVMLMEGDGSLVIVPAPFESLYSKIHSGEVPRKRNSEILNTLLGSQALGMMKTAGRK